MNALSPLVVSELAPDRRDQTFAALRKALDETGSFPGKAGLIVAIFDHVEASTSEALTCLSESLRSARGNPAATPKSAATSRTDQLERAV